MTLLSLSHQKFVQAYLRRPNAAFAYRSAYPGSSPASARKSGSRLLRQPEVEAEIRRLRELGQAAAVLDLAKKREFLARIINDLEQKTSDRLRALKLDAELAGDIDTSLISPQEEVTGDALQTIRGITHADEEEGIEGAGASRSAVADLPRRHRPGQGAVGRSSASEDRAHETNTTDATWNS